MFQESSSEIDIWYWWEEWPWLRLLLTSSWAALSGTEPLVNSLVASSVVYILIISSLRHWKHKKITNTWESRIGAVSSATFACSVMSPPVTSSTTLVASTWSKGVGSVENLGGSKLGSPLELIIRMSNRKSLMNLQQEIIKICRCITIFFLGGFSFQFFLHQTIFQCPLK